MVADASPIFSRSRLPRHARLACALLLCVVSACSSPHGRPVRVIVPQRSNLRVAADSLAKAGIIGSPRLFRLYAKLRGGDRGIKAGTYLLQRGLSWGEVLDALEGGKGLVSMITIPEGWGLTQIVPQLALRLGA